MRGLRPRTTLSVGVIVALVVAVWAALAAGNDDEPAVTTTTATTAAPTTSTTSTTTTTSTTAASSTTVTETTADEEARVEEVRLILEDLWFGWFDAIYRVDEEAVREVVATTQQLDAFRQAVDTADWPRPPTRDDVIVEELEVLRDAETCLVTYSTIDLTSWLGPDALASGVDVMYDHNGGWRFATHWAHEEDLWQNDCTAVRDDELP